MKHFLNSRNIINSRIDPVHCHFTRRFHLPINTNVFSSLELKLFCFKSIIRRRITMLLYITVIYICSGWTTFQNVHESTTKFFRRTKVNYKASHHQWLPTLQYWSHHVRIESRHSIGVSFIPKILGLARITPWHGTIRAYLQLFSRSS